MTINSTTNRVAYTGNGTANPLAVAFPFFTAADLVVVQTVIATGVQTTKALTTDYTVTGTPDANGNYSSGGAVVPNSALTSSVIWTIYRDPALTQLVQHVDNDPLPAASIDTPLDRLTAIAQRTREIALRSIRQPEGEATLDMTIPALVDRKGAILGFDATTGKPSIGVVPTAAALQVVANAAAASAAAAAASAASVAALAVNRDVYNFFDLIYEMNPSGAAALIAQIEANTAGYLDAYFTELNVRGGTWFLPRGYYHLNATINMAPGVKLWGAGDYFSDTPSRSGTAIYLGGTAGQWGMQMLNAVSGNQIEAFSLQDIYFNVTQQGIRWNSASGGFSDDSSSQGYMMRPRVERCFFGMDNTPGTGKGLQFSKSFDIVVRDCGFSNFSTAIDFQGSDIKVVEGCRFDSDTGYSINADSQGTFGSSLRVTGNDFNDPYGFVKSTDLDILIDFNHMEFDRDKTRVTAAVQISGNAFHTKILNNRIQPGNLVTNWLSITADVNRFLVSVHGNTTSAPTQMGSVSFRAQPYFSNGGTRAMVSHGYNSAGDVAFPMNWVEGISHLPPGYAALVTPSTAGVDGGSSNLNPPCDYGCFQIQPNASSTVYMQISDWGNYGLQAGALKGTLTITVVSAAGAAGQQGKWSLHDNSGTPLASGTITHTVANQMYVTTLCTSQAFATNCWLRLWNEDTGHAERFYVYSAAFKIG